MTVRAFFAYAMVCFIKEPILFGNVQTNNKRPDDAKLTRSGITQTLDVIDRREGEFGLLGSH